MDLLAPDVTRIGLPGGAEAAADRVPDELAAGTPEPLRSQLVAELGADRVLARISDLVRYASDASPYRLLPQAVIDARDAGDVAKVFAFGRRNGIPVTLRGAGTSLNGQGQGAGLLVDVRKHFRGVRAEDGGRRARVGPGTVLGHANRLLRRHGFKLGPDPASTDTATVGGVIANNSGGMRCGTWADSYSTVRAMTLVLPSGTVIDTAAPDAEEQLARDEPELATGLLAIRDELRADSELAERVRRKFEIKNTMGYRLCAFLDADTPVEILRRLVVGSEGTLAFIAEAVFETVPVPARTTISWLHFADVETASEPVRALVEAGATAVELMGAPALMVAANSIAGTDKTWLELPPESAALLVEFGGADDAELDAKVARAQEVLSGIELLRPAGWTRDAEAVEVAWQVREGMFGLVGRLRPPETSLIIEDVCVRPDRIAECVRDVQALLGKHAFLPGVAGHASAGNLHFMLTPVLGDPADVERYDAFITDLIELILGTYDGSLKAEHGTGRNMAPFVEREWGAKATKMMWRIKQLCDPDNVLNPGVVLNRDRGGGDDLRRVRLLRAGLPLALADDHAAPADPAAARDGAPAGGLAGDRGPAGRVRVRLDRDLRRRRLLRTRMPARHRHRQAGQGVPGTAAHAARDQGGRGRCGALGGRRAHQPRGPARTRRGPPGLQGRPRPARRRARAATAPRRPAARPCAAEDHARRRGRRLHARLHQPDLRALAAGSPRARLGARRHAGLDPRRRRRPLLRHAVRLEGLHRRGGVHARQDHRRDRTLDGRRTAAAGHRRELVHPRPPD
jgi:FAD/FMN-containing dehydrogenase